MKTKNIVAALSAARKGDGETSFQIGFQIRKIHASFALAKKFHQYGDWLEMINAVEYASGEFRTLRSLLRTAEGTRVKKHK